MPCCSHIFEICCLSYMIWFRVRFMFVPSAQKGSLHPFWLMYSQISISCRTCLHNSCSSYSSVFFSCILFLPPQALPTFVAKIHVIPSHCASFGALSHFASYSSIVPCDNRRFLCIPLFQFLNLFRRYPCVLIISKLRQYRYHMIC